MSIVQLASKTKSLPEPKFAIFSAGFRPFFLLASFFAAFSMLAWMGVYFSWMPFTTHTVTMTQWHAHEMIYGYAMAVIAGFLLTAVSNWTGHTTIAGAPLAGLVSLWLIARLFFTFGSSYYTAAAIADLLFMAALTIAVARPIIKVRQWRQIGILSKVILLLVGNTFFYLGALGYTSNFVYQALHGGLYLVIGLILTIAGRVFPGFIENLISETTPIKNPRWLSPATLVLFLIFSINQLFFLHPTVLLLTSLLLACVTTIRLIFWHRKEIWRKSILWSLYFSVISINIGFIIFACNPIWGTSTLLAIHALAAGGIGLVTMGMMTRVILGHTGRNIREKVKGMPLALSLLVIGACFRVMVPLIDMTHYSTWIFISQCCWIFSFSLFGLVHYQMIVKPRIDGRPE